MQRWALTLARALDTQDLLADETRGLDLGLRLFGVDQFREGQREVVLAALRGESVLAVLPTGSGKSLCYQLAAVLGGQPAAVVLSPLKALMVDQVAGLHARRIPAVFVNSDIQGDEKEQRYELLEAGALSLFYAAPERFNVDRVRPAEVERLLRQRPRFLVVDEAHLVDRWGDFRPDYGRIAELRRRMGSPPILAFTATADPDTQERIKDSLGIADATTVVGGVDRPNISLARVQVTDVRERVKIVKQLIDSLSSGKMLIFVPTINEGHKVREAFKEAGCDLPLYHSKLNKNDRDQIYGRFVGRLDPPLNAVISTSAFSMGLDIPDIRVVVNWQHPGSLEDYVQEYGRAGRDGKESLALLFTDGGDEAKLLKWMAKKTAKEAVVKGVATRAESDKSLVGRIERIDKISGLSRDSARCFRAQLNETLLGTKPRPKPSLAERIIDWAFTRRVRIRKTRECCDVCSPGLAGRFRG